MNADTYWETLTEEQKASFNQTRDRADNEGVDLTIHDAIDIWYCIDSRIRGPKPPED